MRADVKQPVCGHPSTPRAMRLRQSYAAAALLGHASAYLCQQHAAGGATRAGLLASPEISGTSLQCISGPAMGPVRQAS